MSNVIKAVSDVLLAILSKKAEVHPVLEKKVACSSDVQPFPHTCPCMQSVQLYQPLW